MDPLQRLLMEAACRDLIVRGCAAVDTPDPEAFAALFAQDGVLERPGGSALIGREAIRQAYANRAADRITRHLVTNILLDINAQQARATSTVLLWSGSGKDAPGPYGRPAEPRQVLGEFHDTLVLTNEGWRIARRRALFVLHASQ